MGETFFNRLKDIVATRKLPKPHLYQKNTFDIDYKKCTPGLIPIAQLLETLINAKVTMLNGAPLQVQLLPLGYSLLIYPTRYNYDSIYISFDNVTSTFGLDSSTNKSGTLRVSSLETIEGALADKLGMYVASLGYFDKSIYSKKSQEVIGIE
jgi:hypothetical protein